MAKIKCVVLGRDPEDTFCCPPGDVACHQIIVQLLPGNTVSIVHTCRHTVVLITITWYYLLDCLQSFKRFREIRLSLKYSKIWIQLFNVTFPETGDTDTKLDALTLILVDFNMSAIHNKSQKVPDCSNITLRKVNTFKHQKDLKQT